MTRSNTSLSWQQQRNHFNHDWLKNRFLIKLGALWNRVKSAHNVSRVHLEACRDAIRAWAEHRDTARELIEAYRELESPRALFDISPLSSCNDEVQSWLPDFIHQHWLTSHRVETLVQDALMAWQEVNENASQLETALEREGGECELSAPVNRLRHSVSALSDAISSFPSRQLI